MQWSACNATFVCRSFSSRAATDRALASNTSRPLNLTLPASQTARITIRCSDAAIRRLEYRMGAAVDITRRDHLPAELRALAAKSDDAAQTLRDWVHRHNEVGVDGLASRKPPGAAPKLSEAQTSELRGLVLAGPDPKTDKVVRWRCLDVREEVIQRFRHRAGAHDRQVVARTRTDPAATASVSSEEGCSGAGGL